MVHCIDTDTFITLQKQAQTGKIVILDTLVRDSYDSHHIPGAYHVSYQKDYSEIDRDSNTGGVKDIDSRFLVQFKEQVPASNDTHIITYSGSLGCGLSYLAALCLVRAGYQNVSCYKPGLQGWVNAGRELVATP